MQNVVKMRNYELILKTFLSYLPSRVFVIFNSLIIIPVFAYFLTTSEMSIFQISIGILNLVCTMTTDWIAKTVLRFYSRYKTWKKTDKFFSTIMILEIIAYFLIFLSFFVFKNIVAEKFYLSQNIFLLTLILVVPCGIRQIFYQILRVLKMPKLYTVSIVIYQITLLLLFFAFTPFVNNVIAILTAMTFGIFFIDCIIIFILKFKEKFEWKIDKKILKTILIYAIPLVITCVCIWSVLNIGKFIFQYNQDFINTALVGTAWFFVTNALTPLFSLLIFAVFPTVIKKFEKKEIIKPLMSAVLNSYILLFIPFVCIFLFYSYGIAKLAFKEEYLHLGILFPFCAISIFIHEFMKLMNIKYHLKNKTYIETTISLIIAIFSVILYAILIDKFSILGYGFALVISILMLTICNSFVNFKTLNYLDFKRIFKCLIYCLLICLAIFSALHLCFIKWQSNISTVIQIILFILAYFLLIFKFKNVILK